MPRKLSARSLLVVSGPLSDYREVPTATPADHWAEQQKLAFTKDVKWAPESSCLSRHTQGRPETLLEAGYLFHFRACGAQRSHLSRTEILSVHTYSAETWHHFPLLFFSLLELPPSQFTLKFVHKKHNGIDICFKRGFVKDLNEINQYVAGDIYVADCNRLWDRK